LYVGLAIVVASLVAHRHRRVRTVAWLIGVLLPVLVGVSRVYRGMHFPTDVLASVLLACGALAFALLAVRSMSAAASERDRRASSRPADSPQRMAS
jgi:undecaprenyl-diphosphatase